MNTKTTSVEPPTRILLFIIKQNFSKYLDIPFRKLFSSLTKIRAWNWFCFLGFACCCHNVRNSVTAKWRQVSLSHVDRWSDFVVFTASKLFFFLMTNDDRILGNHLERQQRSIGGLLVHKMTLLSYIAWEIWQSENEMTKFQRVTQIHWISSASVLHNVSLIISSICPPKTEGILRPTSFSLSLFSEIKNKKWMEKVGKFVRKIRVLNFKKFDLDLAGKAVAKNSEIFTWEINVEVFLKRERVIW